MAHKSSAPTGGENFELVPAGSHLAICCIVAYIGYHKSPGFNGKPPENRPKMVYIWELCEKTTKEGKPFTIACIHTDSLHAKANMRKMLECWRSRPFTSEELRGFEINKVLGKPCIVSVIHKEKNNDDHELAARVQAVLAVPKGTKCPEPRLPLLYYSVDGDPESCDILMLPEWIRKMALARVDAPVAKAVEQKPEEEVETEIPF